MQQPPKGDGGRFRQHRYRQPRQLFPQAFFHGRRQGRLRRLFFTGAQLQKLFGILPRHLQICRSIFDRGLNLAAFMPFIETGDYNPVRRCLDGLLPLGRIQSPFPSLHFQARGTDFRIIITRNDGDGRNLALPAGRLNPLRIGAGTPRSDLLGGFPLEHAGRVIGMQTVKNRRRPVRPIIPNQGNLLRKGGFQPLFHLIPAVQAQLLNRPPIHKYHRPAGMAQPRRMVRILRQNILGDILCRRFRCRQSRHCFIIDGCLQSKPFTQLQHKRHRAVFIGAGAPPAHNQRVDSVFCGFSAVPFNDLPFMRIIRTAKRIVSAL